MKRILLLVAALVMAPWAHALDTVTISPVAEFAEPGRITDNIKAECNLPTLQSQLLLKHLGAVAISASLAPDDAPPSVGAHIVVRITDAVSSGNAFVGHRKSVTVSARLYVDGVEVATSTKSRDSMGGFGGGFKGSCSVLGRCCEALSKDLAQWAAAELRKH